MTLRSYPAYRRYLLRVGMAFIATFVVLWTATVAVRAIDHAACTSAQAARIDAIDGLDAGDRADLLWRVQ